MFDDRPCVDAQMERVFIEITYGRDLVQILY